MSVFQFQTRVNYDDVDQNLRLTLKGAMGYMQEAALIHSGQVGYSVGDIEETHLIWMLIQWRVRMITPASWNDVVTVETWPRTMERATSIRNFRITNHSGETVAIGESNWVLVNANTGRIVRISKEVAAAYDLTDTTVFDDPMPEIPISVGDFVYRGSVMRRDIDTNKHVNNRVYLDYARDALPDALADSSFSEVSVRYRKQLLAGQEYSCYYKYDADRHIVEICGITSDEHHGTVVFST